MRIRGEIGNVMLVLEHEPVYTLGRQKKLDYLKYPRDEYLQRFGAQVVDTDRGGDVTFHGPGTLMVYPIINIKDINCRLFDYIGRLEQLMINTLGQYGVKAAPGEGNKNRGVWVGDDKIGSIGVQAQRFVTSHGLSMNVCTDLSYFDHIVACGLEGVDVTSLKKEIGKDVSVEEATEKMLSTFTDVFPELTLRESEMKLD
eukprot:TRINITY_DN9588_c0_g1_i1.p1 TRINITY_DN9588_c0_g1~~TRINITY_DN9588_c0_g1_i1.p1  ORF type:complete len:227 (-),score=51.59 TRINITY_DN9588_c0_g1_i1:50-649(-)